MAEGKAKQSKPENIQPTSLASSDSAQPPPEIEDTEKSPETVQRAMRKMAEKAPDEFVEMTAMMGNMMGHPLHQKMNEEHITKMLDLAVQHDTNEFELRKGQQEIDAKNGVFDRCSHLFYFAVFIGLVVLILTYFRNQPTVLAPILTGVGGAVTGFIGGIGYAKANPSKKSK